MQYMTSQEQSRPDEMALLGERYQLGNPEGVYYVLYTREDIRRYRITRVIIGIALLYIIWAIINLILMIINWSSHSNGFLPVESIGSMFILVYVLSMRRKWGNRPIIGIENRHERVYVYQNGLVKQTNKHCNVVRWSEVLNVKYTPPIPDFQDPKFRSSNLVLDNAGLQITRHGKKKLYLSGALCNIDGLASLLNYHINLTP